MLSRVAQRLYWMSRYLERVENTARLMGVYTNLLLDMPSGVNIGWYNLVTLNDAEEWFESRYKVKDERNVMRFLLADPDYAGSMLSSLQRVRENIRTTRDVVPAESWEYINELTLFVQDNLTMGVNRGQRHAFIASVIKSCQQFLGLFVGGMSEGQGRAFLRIGRNIERADMTTRILDAGIKVVLENNGNVLPATEAIIWVNVLRSLSGYLPYTKQQRKTVRGTRVARYLLEDTALPRTLRYCCAAVRHACVVLPRNDAVLAHVDRLLASHYAPLDDEDAVLNQEFSDYLNHLQLQIAELHQLCEETWFTFE
ncbi:MAG: alpha-E domain-containing protein [Porticoccaceae bacterium]